MTLSMWGLNTPGHNNNNNNNNNNNDNNNRLGQDTGGGAWCPRDPVGPDPDSHQQWLGVNLTQPHVITSVLTQGR